VSHSVQLTPRPFRKPGLFFGARHAAEQAEPRLRVAPPCKVLVSQHGVAVGGSVYPPAI